MIKIKKNIHSDYYSPIVIFSYTKLATLKKLLKSLKKNKNYRKHKLYIFSDGPKTNNVTNKVTKVRNYFKKNTKKGLLQVAISDLKCINS